MILETGNGNWVHNRILHLNIRKFFHHIPLAIIIRRLINFLFSVIGDRLPVRFHGAWLFPGGRDDKRSGSGAGRGGGESCSTNQRLPRLPVLRFHR